MINEINQLSELLDIAKDMLRGKFLALNIYENKKGRIKSVSLQRDLKII